MHAVTLAHTKLPAQGAAAPAVPQLPVPVQAAAGVSWPLLHDAVPQVVVLPGKTHAPVESQSSAPHAPPDGLQGPEQQ